MDYLLTGICAYAHFSKDVTYGPALVRRVMESRRVIANGKIEITQVFIPHDKLDANHGWTTGCEANSIAVSHRDSFYLLRVNDALSPERIVDCIHAATSLCEHPIEDETVTLLPFSKSWLPKRGVLRWNDLLTNLERLDGRRWHPSNTKHLGLSMSCGGAERDEMMWTLIPMLLTEERLLYAALFLRASEEQIAFKGDDIEDTVLRADDFPLQLHEAVKIENAIHNAYKVVEAIYGGTLSNDEQKVRKQLQSQGIFVDEPVGYQHHGLHPREPILLKIAKLREARDDRAAHGRIHANRKNTYYELMDYQALARTILWMRIRHMNPGLGPK